MVANTGSCVSGAPLIVQRNMAFGRLSITTPSTSMTSSLTFLTRSARPLRSFPLARAAFFPKRAVVDGDDGCANVGCVRTEAPAAGRDEEGANALTLVEDRQIKALRRTRIYFIILFCLQEGPTMKGDDIVEGADRGRAARGRRILIGR